MRIPTPNWRRAIAPALLLLLTAPAVAQPEQFTLPIPAGVPTTDRSPLGLESLRYQLWFSRAQWLATAQTPFRCNQLSWVGGAGAAAPSFQATMRIRMANSNVFGPSPVFNGNFLSPPVEVFPMQTTLLPALGPGSTVTFPFATEFVWDGVSGVVVDVQMFSNGLGMPVDYFMVRSLGVPGNTAILSAPGPASNNATRIDLGQALVTTFSGNEGVTTPFGDGCRNAHVNEPVAVQTGGVPRPNNQQFALEVENINPALPCFLFLGVSREMSVLGPLPFNLSMVGFPGGCELLVSPDLIFSTTSTGGAPGTARGVIDLPVPPLSALIGTSLFSQFWVIDPSATGGILATSQGLWTQFAQ